MDEILEQNQNELHCDGHVQTSKLCVEKVRKERAKH